MHAKLGEMTRALQVLSAATNDQIIDRIQAYPCMRALVTKSMHLIVFCHKDNRVICVFNQDIAGFHRLFV